jgi:hypothetical protein
MLGMQWLRFLRNDETERQIGIEIPTNPRALLELAKALQTDSDFIKRETKDKIKITSLFIQNKNKNENTNYNCITTFFI